ncbi:DUF805 domain-containing protein [Hyphomonas sp. WL0036]|uniref:DUF805 domain-containing protein n=1 Tax=Hyphomonas sediminis TaxID=2866160 RepID=UPI001C8253FE|nr:DUF805 domain-containing protein [Hyphomonas sediminis]MBY9066994.1 DUF805 domain-containing protein [Hyphomonas sediminis]
MDYRQIFLDPQGRIGPRSFGRAYILLTGVMLVITAAAAVISPQINVLQYALVFPYICVFGKRLHDAGQTAWLWLVILILWMVLNAIVGGVLLQLMSPQALELSREMMGAIMSPESVNEARLRELVEEFGRLSAVPNLISFLISSAAAGLVVFNLKSDPNPNRYGAPAAHID